MKKTLIKLTLLIYFVFSGQAITTFKNGKSVNILKGYQKLVDREIHIFSSVQEIKYKNKEAIYTIIATYLGSSLDDYYSFPFIADDRKYYDFAYGKNNLGDIPFDHYDKEMKSELIGKKFIINWSWKASSYPCCEGQMNNNEDDIASILSIEYHNSDNLNKN